MSLAWEEAIMQLRVNQRKTDMKWEPQLFYVKLTYLVSKEIAVILSQLRGRRGEGQLSWSACAPSLFPV